MFLENKNIHVDSVREHTKDITGFKEWRRIREMDRGREYKRPCVFIVRSGERWEWKV